MTGSPAAPPAAPSGSDRAAVLTAAAREALRAGRREDALRHCRDALAAAPGTVAAADTLAVLLHESGRDADAEAVLRAAIPVADEPYPLRVRLGALLAAGGRREDAATALRDAAAGHAAPTEALWRLGECLRVLGRPDEALVPLREALALAPADENVLSQLLFAAMRAAAWDGLEDLRARLRAAVEATLNAGGVPAVRPLIAITLYDDPALVARVAAAHAAAIAAAQPRRTAPPARRRPRLRIGYLSAGFHDHPTGHLVRRLFALHDRDRFEIVGLSLHPDDGSPFRRDIAAGCDRFVDLHGLGTDAAEARVRDADLDILVDLHPFVAGHRMALAARRVAPVQVAWLGFPGTTGAAFYDYAVVDAVVAPPGAERHFTERLVTLPGCYQPCDPDPPVAAAPPTRTAAGLPDDAVVFACFNNTYKIEPACFDAWVEILTAVPGSCLWLLHTSDAAVAGLGRAAAARGLDPSRLVFAPRLPKAGHLARLALADIALDTWTCNGHTTTTDALWAGVPVVTLPGRQFAARVAASLVNAAGVPDLAIADRESYVGLAVSLARDAARRRAISESLRAGRTGGVPLFDLAGRVRALEAAWRAMADLATAGRPPQAMRLVGDQA